MNMCAIIVWSTIALQPCAGSWQGAGTLRDVIWDNHFLMQASKNMCKMTQLLKSCERNLTLERIDIVFRVSALLMADSRIIELHCEENGRQHVYGCFLVECMDMPSRVWCRTFLPRCMLYGKVDSQCVSIISSHRTNTLCTIDYLYYSELCKNSSAGYKKKYSNDFLFTGKRIDIIYESDVEDFMMDFEGPLRPSNTLLFVIICFITPFLIKFFLPNLWMFIAYALFSVKETKQVAKSMPFKKRFPPPEPILRRWFRWLLCWLLRWLLRLCEWLRWAANVECGISAPPMPPPLPPAPLRGPLFQLRAMRPWAAPGASRLQYRLYRDSLACGCGGQLVMPVADGEAAEAEEAAPVCLRPLGVVYRSHEYAHVHRLLSEHAAQRRGECAEPRSPPFNAGGGAGGGWRRFADLGLDPRRLALARTYLGTLQEAYNSLQPNTQDLAKLQSPVGNNVYLRMFRAQENLRHTLWMDIERVTLQAGRRREQCLCAAKVEDCDDLN